MKNKNRSKQVKLKCIVEPIGAFMFLNTDMTEIHFNRPSVTTKTDFVEQIRDDGKIKILAVNLPLEANDDDFKDCYMESKGNKELAIDSYCAEFGIDRTGEALVKD